MGGMKRRSTKVPVTSSAGIERGLALQVDVGERAELTQVLAVRGNTLKVGRVHWWHRLLWWIQRLPGRVRRLRRRGMCVIRERLCGMRDHRIAAVRGDCWCGERWDGQSDWMAE